MIKELIINWAIKQLIATEPMGMTEAEQYGILARLNSVEGLDRLLKALISADIIKYTEIPEDNKMLQSRNKGSIIRLKWLSREMQNAESKLQELTNPKGGDNSDQP